MSGSLFKPVRHAHGLLCFGCVSNDPARVLRLFWAQLPPPQAVRTGCASVEDAAATLRRAASLRLDGARRALQQGGQHVPLAIELLEGAGQLYDRAFMSLTGCPVQSVLPPHHQTQTHSTVLAAYGLSAVWGEDLRPLVEEGRRCAQAWLEQPTLPLWWALAQDRAQHRAGAGRDAFEAGFLLKVQQTLNLDGLPGHPAPTHPASLG